MKIQSCSKNMPVSGKSELFYRHTVALAIFCALVINSEPVLAHGSERGLVLLLPSKFYIAGGASAVAASFLFLAFVPASWIKQWAGFCVRLFLAGSAQGKTGSFISFGALSVIVFAGLIGTPDPLTNPLPILIWTLWWVVFTIAQSLTGNLWPYFNPWSGPVWLIRKYSGHRPPLMTLPDRIGYLPAIILFLGFVWFELISLSPENPESLAWVVIVYWLLNLVAILIFGEQSWFDRGEPFSIIFRLVGSIAPLQRSNANHRQSALNLVFPGARLSGLPPLPLTGILFVLLALSAVSFDGLSNTFFWMRIVGVNPLEFPGRSAVMLSNSIGLIVCFVVLAGVFLGCVYMGCLLAGRAKSFLYTSGKWVYSIVPILLAFHFAHYLAQILLNLQYAIVAFNDPFSIGWNLLGMDNFHVSSSVFNQIDTVEIIWKTQTTVIVIGHILGIWVAHAIALQIYGQISDAIKSQLFLVVLMINYTTLGLWLLSTASIA